MGTKVKLKGQGRLFQNPILESFTKSSPLESTLSSLAIAAFCIWMGKEMGAGFRFWNIFWYFMSGLLFWTFAEYMLHRYLFHITEENIKGGDRFSYIIHGIHHEYPNDAQRTLLPFVPKLILSAIFFGLFYLILGKAGAFFSSGFVMGYYFYSIMHYSIHRYKAPKWLKPLWEHHHRHHHLVDDQAFGVSSTLWDRIFGTMPEKVENKSKTVEM
jgi:sterol desaturase/sphingolipid hydroxylase (fatty acid hydroxylase superfamily)